MISLHKNISLGQHVSVSVPAAGDRSSIFEGEERPRKDSGKITQRRQETVGEADLMILQWKYKRLVARDGKLKFLRAAPFPILLTSPQGTHTHSCPLGMFLDFYTQTNQAKLQGSGLTAKSKYSRLPPSPPTENTILKFVNHSQEHSIKRSFQKHTMPCDQPHQIPPY